MSWIWIPILIIWIAAAVNGYRRGFLRIFLRFVLTIVLLVVLYPIIESLLMDHTPILQQIEEGCVEIFEGAFGTVGEMDRNSQVSFVNNLPLLDFVKNDLIENNNSVIYGLLSVETFQEYIINYLVNMIFNALVFLLTLLIVDIIVKIVVDVFDIFSKLPIVGFFNRIGGLAIGVGKGFLYLWIFFIAVTLFMGTGIGGYILEEILHDPYLYYLYENNVLIQYLVSWIVA